MTLGIMQPYIFPYLGYFQLLHAVDTFVVYDDVGFIKQGWINRNSILLNGNKYQFTIPIQNISSNNKIKETFISDKPHKWEQKFLETIVHAYKKAPFFDNVFQLAEALIKGSAGKSLGALAFESLETVIKYLSIDVKIIRSPSIFNNNHLSNEARVIDICIQCNAKTYINALGGRELYNASYFNEKGIQLLFLRPANISYRQFENIFIPSLSIIDVMMFNDVESIRNLLGRYDLI